MADPDERSNRLGAESSPYLLLHQHNPVDWYPWGSEAFAKARAEDRPIFLSVGYSTCYWCHVMERESFSDPSIAELMNRDFVNIKVDREERPEIDEIYMTATQILTHRGGWPNSVFLTPELKPFFAGTYFPPEDRRGLTGFRSVLVSLAEAWRHRRGEVEEQAEAVVRALGHHLEESFRQALEPPPAELADRCLEDLRRRFDPDWGGFGGAPKFPTPSNLLLLLELADSHEVAASMLGRTLDAMARGGIYDQLAGGFHRYATDRKWRVPHFEKMLYDSALLLEVYARHWQLTADAESARIVAETASFIADELTGGEGELWSAIDAETEGREGAYYVWEQQELIEGLGEEDFGFLAPILGFATRPAFEGRYHVLHLPEPLPAQAERRRMSLADLLAEMASPRQKLLAVRRRRPRPATDDKVLSDWSGLAIAGLAQAGLRLGERRWVKQAEAAAEFVLSRLRPTGRLVHSWRQGRTGPEAFLADYAFLSRGLLALYRATEESRWLDRAADLTTEQSRRLADEHGGFFVAAASDDVLFRSKEVMDGALPGANAVAVMNLVELAGETGERRWLAGAEAALSAFAELAERHPAAVKTLAVANHRFRRAAEASESIAKTSRRRVTDSGLELEEEARRVVRPHLTLQPLDAEGWRDFVLRIEIAPGWHLYAPGSEASDPKGLRLTADGVVLSSLAYPIGERAGDGEGSDERVYRGQIRIGGRLRLTGRPSPRLRLRLQACDRSRCLPMTALDIPIAG